MCSNSSSILCIISILKFDYGINPLIKIQKIILLWKKFRLIGAEGVRPPAGLAGQVRPRRQSRGGSPPAPRSRAPGVEIRHDKDKRYDRS
jgi:hypothetical protein